MPETMIADAAPRARARRRATRLLSLLCTALLMSAGSFVFAAPAQAIVVTVDIDGLNYTLDDNGPNAEAQVNGFSAALGQTTLTIPSEVLYFGKRFYVTTVGDFAFDALGLTSVSLPGSLVSIATGAFSENDLTSIQLPDGLALIGHSAFAKNDIESVVIPNTVQTISHYAFYQNALTSLDLGTSVQAIGMDAFSVNRLVSLSVPDSVTGIDQSAFMFNQLHDVVLGKSVRAIGDNAFTRNFAWDWAPHVIPWGVDFTIANASLRSVTFTGPAPTTFTLAGTGVLPDKSGSFGPAYNVTVYYPLAFQTGDPLTGFTPGSWRGYPTRAITSVGFELNGHGNPIGAQTILVGDKAVEPATPIATGWTFTGWFADAALKIPFSFNTAISAKTTVYAGWIVTPLPTATVSFTMNGHGTAIAPQTVTIGKVATKPTSPTATGWAFTGWFADATLKTPFNFTTTIKANTTLYAGWAPTATVSFAMSGHGTAIAKQTVTIGKTVAKPTSPTATGWAFTGWYTSTSLKTPFNFAGAIKANTTLYAGWVKAPSATVSFNLNGHGTAITKKIVTIGKTVAKPTSPTATGWTFTGWFTSSTLKTPFNFASTIKANTTLYAGWVVKR